MMVISIVTYGLVNYRKRGQVTAAGKTLATLQRLACLGITGGIPLCPKNGMEVILMFNGQKTKHPTSCSGWVPGSPTSTVGAYELSCLYGPVIGLANI